jgi:polyphosphate kinase 2 (PPK2 family)
MAKSRKMVSKKSKKGSRKMVSKKSKKGSRKMVSKKSKKGSRKMVSKKSKKGSKKSKSPRGREKNNLWLKERFDKLINKYSNWVKSGKKGSIHSIGSDINNNRSKVMLLDKLSDLSGGISDPEEGQIMEILEFSRDVEQYYKQK